MKKYQPTQATQQRHPGWPVQYVVAGLVCPFQVQQKRRVVVTYGHNGVDFLAFTKSQRFIGHEEAF